MDHQLFICFIISKRVFFIICILCFLLFVFGWIFFNILKYKWIWNTTENDTFNRNLNCYFYHIKKLNQDGTFFKLRIFRKCIFSLIYFEQMRYVNNQHNTDLLLWMWLHQQEWTGIWCLHVRSSGYNRWPIHNRYYLKLLRRGLRILCCACRLGTLMKLL